MHKKISALVFGSLAVLLSGSAVLWSEDADAHFCYEACTDQEDEQAMEQLLGATCGFPPSQWCAYDYFDYVVDDLADWVVYYTGIMNLPGWQDYCTAYPMDCLEVQQQYFHIAGIYQYAVGRLADYS